MDLDTVYLKRRQVTHTDSPNFCIWVPLCMSPQQHEAEPVLTCRGGGRTDEAVITAKRSELEAVLKRAGISVPHGSRSRLYEYYPPFAPSWLRLHDVLLPVEGDPAALKADTTTAEAHKEQ